MLNINFTLAMFLGFVVCLSIVVLYVIRTIKPVIARDEDIFFTTMGLLYSGILMSEGWRLDPLLLFSQILIISMFLFAGWENIRLRGILANLLNKFKNKS